MKNIQVKVSPDGSQLQVTIDLEQDFGPSKSGKTTIIASTEGNQSITPDGVVLGLNVYKKRS